MATISSLGVGSGIDASSIITQLMAIEKQPLTNLQSAGSKIQTQISEVGKIKSAVSTLNDAAAKLASSEQGFFAMSFVLSLFAAVAVQKNIRDLAPFKEEAAATPEA